MKKDPNITLTTQSISWFGSLLTVGAAIGSLLAGNLIDKMGRKFQILFGNVMFVAGWMLIIADKSSIKWACVGRVFGGLGNVILLLQLYSTDCHKFFSPFFVKSDNLWNLCHFFSQTTFRSKKTL